MLVLITGLITQALFLGGIAASVKASIKNLAGLTAEFREARSPDQHP